MLALLLEDFHLMLLYAFTFVHFRRRFNTFYSTPLHIIAVAVFLKKVLHRKSNC